jgi:hypothetical protein
VRRVSLEIAPNPHWVSSWVSKLITMVIKKTSSNTWFWYIIVIIKKIKYQVITYNHGSQMFWKTPNIHLKSWGFLCQFFHEAQQFFEVFEIPGTNDYLNLIFSNTQNQRVFKNQIPTPHWSELWTCP